jgi:hypothetical protein
MNNEGYAPPQCEFDAVNRAVIEACDGLDGLMDDIISAPGLCTFNASSLIGKKYTCNGTTRTFPVKMATVVNKIWEGPTSGKGAPLWYGITPGTNFSSLAATESFPNGTTIPLPFEISNTWFQNYLFTNPKYNTSRITYSEFPQLVTKGQAMYNTVIGTANAHLSSFASTGAKIITWQGLADNLIMPNGTMNYFSRVKELDANVHEYYRVFFAPGVGHCGGGTGPIPLDPLMALRAWRENGTVPDVLEAASSHPVNGTIRRQNLCPYPLVSKYNGRGDSTKASSFSCVENY